MGDAARYILQAAGVGYRWRDHLGRDYLGVRKHHVVLDGERLIDRTVRQLAERGCETWIVARAGIPGYDVPPAVTFTPDVLDVVGSQPDTFLSSQPIWNADGPTVLMYGDVWWTDEAIDMVTTYQGPDPWHIWYRPGGSKVTGCGHGEIFAHRFDADQHDNEAAACRRVHDLHERGLIPWLNTGGWAIYRAMLGLPDDQVHGWGTPNFAHATLVDDWTDDFDGGYDYSGWYGRRTKGRYPARIVFTGTSPDVRATWPVLDSDQPAAVVIVDGDLQVSEWQVWCGIAHAVEHHIPVVPYSHVGREPASGWTSRQTPAADEADRRILITPIGVPDGVEPVRLYGYCQET